MARTPVDGVELKERVVDINRVAKVVKGGRRFSFTALVVVGDENGNVGAGYGKAREVPLAIQKAILDAKKNMFKVPRYRTTIPHEMIGVYGAGRVLLKPASEGTGVIAAAGVRAVLELAGVHDILTKCLGTTNPINMVRATVTGLQGLKTPADVARLRGITVARCSVCRLATRRGQSRRAGRAADRRRGVTMAQLEITQIKSGIGTPPDHRGTLRALGLKRMHHTVVHEDNPVIRGMIRKVSYLVEVRPATKKS